MKLKKFLEYEKYNMKNMWDLLKNIDNSVDVLRNAIRNTKDEKLKKALEDRLQVRLKERNMFGYFY